MAGWVCPVCSEVIEPPKPAKLAAFDQQMHLALHDDPKEATKKARSLQRWNSEYESGD